MLNSVSSLQNNVDVLKDDDIIPKSRSFLFCFEGVKMSSAHAAGLFFYEKFCTTVYHTKTNMKNRFQTYLIITFDRLS